VTSANSLSYGLVSAHDEASVCHPGQTAEAAEDHDQNDSMRCFIPISGMDGNDRAPQGAASACKAGGESILRPMCSTLDVQPRALSACRDRRNGRGCSTPWG